MRPIAKRRTTKVRKSTGRKRNRKHRSSGCTCALGALNCGSLSAVSATARNLLGLLLIFAAQGACGSPGKNAQITSNKQPELPTQALQDQRFKIASVRVHTATALDTPPLDTSASRQTRLALHSESELTRVARDGAHDVRVCAEELLSPADSPPKLDAASRELILSLELDAAGLVLGGTTSPRGGEAGLSRVASCLLRRARQWKFPGRTTPGSTVLVVPYLLD